MAYVTLQNVSLQAQVQPLLVADNSINRCKHISWFFRHEAVRIGHLILERGSIRLLLLALSPTFSQHDFASASGFSGSQVEIGGGTTPLDGG